MCRRRLRFRRRNRSGNGVKPTSLSPKRLQIKRESQFVKLSSIKKPSRTSIREALVNRLTMAIRASLSLGEVLSTATVELGRALAASRVHLFLLDSEGVSAPHEHEYLGSGCSQYQTRRRRLQRSDCATAFQFTRTTDHRRRSELRRRLRRVE